MQHRGIDYVHKLREDDTLDDAGVQKRILDERNALLSLLNRQEPHMREERHIDTYHMLEVASVYHNLGDPDHPSAQKRLRCAIDGTNTAGEPLTSTMLRREKESAAKQREAKARKKSGFTSGI